jgi:cysteine desulfurase/selenocysteine lyase
MAHFGVPATCRASLAFYNTEAEIAQLGDAIDKARKLLA